jgi:hypothetical protein
MKIHQAQSQGEVDSSHCIMSFVNGNELTLREDLSVIFEFVERVGDLCGVYQLANLDDGLGSPRGRPDGFYSWLEA